MILKVSDRFDWRKCLYFDQFTFNWRYDSVASSFSYMFYFDPKNPAHVELACVSHFHLCELYDSDDGITEGELLLTGIITKQSFKAGPVKHLSGFAGYSKPGQLEDSKIHPDYYPLQSNKLSLTEVAKKLIKPFKLDLVVDDSVSGKANKVFDTTNASESSTVKDFLHELAKQKDIVISHNEKGELLFTEANPKQTPILEFDLTKGSIPGIEFDFEFDGSGMHSHIVVMGQAGADGGNAKEYEIRNPYVPVVYRPTTVTQSSGDDNDTSLFARRELAKELRGLKWTIQLDRWKVDGKLVRPGKMVKIIAPELYNYVSVKLFIESIDFVGDPEKQTATLHCVLPEVYTNQIPVSIFKGMNMTAKPHIV